MRDLKLDPVTRDLDLSGGLLKLTAKGAESVRQRLTGRLSLRKGEWFLDQSIGIPYDDVLGKIKSLPAIESMFRKAITTCPGVALLTSFSLTVNANREASLTFEAVATDGTPISLEDFVAGPL